MRSVLSDVIEFFERFGLFDVVLPFLLVFTIVFAVLEKTKILGEEDGKPKKNLDSAVAFVVALLVTGVTYFADILRVALPNVSLVLIVSICFLMLVGLFWGAGEVKVEAPWQKGLIFVIMFLVVLGIFFDAMGWLDDVMNYAAWGNTFVPGLIFFAIIIGAIIYVVGPSKEGQTKKGG